MYKIKILLTIFTIAIIGSCGKKETTLDKKKAELAKLQTELAKINAKIKEVNAQISKLDTTASKNNNSKLVAILPATTSVFTNYIQVIGRVDAEQNTNVSSEMPGVVKRIYVSTGQQVYAGQVLAELDASTMYSGIQEIKQQISFAETMYEKQKNLFEQGIGTEVQYLSAKNNLESLKKRLATNNEQVKMTRIKSPINGVIDDVFAKVGQMASPGFPTFRVINMGKLKVKAEMAESYIGKVKQGNKVILNIPDLNKNYDAHIQYIGKVIDPLNRAFRVEIALPSSSDLKPNMVAKISIIDYQNPSAVVVPVNIIQKSEDQNYIMLAVEKNGIIKVEKRIVTVGGNFNGQVEIKSGINTGDKIITTGFQDLEDGDIISY